MKSFLKKIIPFSLLLVYHKWLALLANFYYRSPSKRLIVIGVTGTKGKSTVVNMIAKVLEEAGFKVGLTSGINFKVDKKEWPNETKMSMLGRFALQHLIHQMVQAGCQYAVIETTSEGILQFRHLGVHYDIMVFTNLSPEHIEAHGSFENYRKAKSEVFKKLEKQKNKKINRKMIPKISVVNLDDKNAGYFLGFVTDKKYGFRINNKELRERGDKLEVVKAENLNLNQAGTDFTVGQTQFHLKLPGEFNVANALATVCVGLSQNIDLEIIKGALEKVSLIPGRLEKIEAGQNFTVIVDYAHEPASLKEVYQTIKLFNPQRIISVLGSQGGGRDKKKRPILGRLAAEHTDYIIITNEDPYDEDPGKIIDEVAEGVQSSENRQEGENFWKISDRQEAIRKALSLARQGDLIIITGKGCETRMAGPKGEKIPWDERKVVREELGRLGKLKMKN